MYFAEQELCFLFVHVLQVGWGVRMSNTPPLFSPFPHFHFLFYPFSFLPFTFTFFSFLSLFAFQTCSSVSSPRWGCPSSSTSKTTPPLRQLSFSWNFSQSSFRWSKDSLAKGGTGRQGQQKWITIIFSKLSDLLGQNGDSRAAQRSASHNVGKFAYSSSSEKLFNQTQRYHHPWISSLTGILANISTLTLILLISWAKLTTSTTSTTSSAPQKHVTRPERQVSESSEEEVRGYLISSSRNFFLQIVSSFQTNNFL